MKRKSNPAKRTQTAVIVAAVLFAVTFFLHYVLSTLIAVPAGTINTWKFTDGKTVQAISGDIVQYRQATAENPVTKRFGYNYIRMQYTLPAVADDQRLTLCTDYNPVKITLDGKELLNNNFDGEAFAGSAYQNVKIDSNGNERVLDIYIYAPLSFRAEAVLEADSAVSTGFSSGYVGLGLSAAAFFGGILLFILSILLSPGTKSIRRMIMLSVTVIFGGAVGAVYTLSRTTSLLSSRYWFTGLIIGQLVLMVLLFMTLLVCYDKTVKNVLVFIPAVIVCAVIPIFATAWAVQLSACAIAAAELYISIRALMVFATVSGNDVPQLGVMQGLVLYSALTGLFNAVCLITGMSMLSNYLFTFPPVILCLVIYVVYSRQVIYLDLKKYERIAQIYKDSTWIEGLTDLISRMFLQKDENTFLCEVARSLSAIIEKNAEMDEEIDVRACVGVETEDGYTEIYNEGNLENCAYADIAGHLDGEELPLLIGNTTVDMMFRSEKRHAILHFENILCGMYGNMANIIRAAYGNLRIAFQNLNLTNDMSSMQIELIIHLAQIAERRSFSTGQHQIAVSGMVYELCRELQMDEKQSRLISTAAMAHDIGKIAISESILEKSGHLSDEEFAVMKRHTEFGYNILSLQSGEFFIVAAKIALEHHENYDGSGYNGKKGRDIDPGARVVHLIDVFEALLSARPYKTPWSAEEAVKYITDNRGKQFDPAVTDAFVNCSDRLVALREKLYEQHSDADGIDIDATVRG